MVIVRKHIGEELFFQILNKFGDSWGFLPIEMKSSAATEVVIASVTYDTRAKYRRLVRP